MRFASALALTLFSAPVCAQPAPLFTIPATDAAVMGEPRTLFAATPRGLFRSTDDGSNWRPLAVRPRGEHQPPFHLLMPYPIAPRTLFAATETSEGALWRTTDNGESWAQVNRGLPEAGPAIEQLIFPNSSGFEVIYARAGFELYKSVNGGVTWVRQSSLPPSKGLPATIAIHPRDPTYMFYAFGTGIYRSLNEGHSWDLFPSLRLPVGAGVWSMLMDPFQDNLTYVGAGGTNAAGQEVGGFYLSTTNGRNSAEAGLALVTGQLRPLYLYSNRSEPLRLYTTETPCVTAARTTVTCIAKSVDTRQSGGVAAGRSWGLRIVSDVNGIARLGIHPQNSDVMVAATGRGISLSTDGGETWRPRSGFVTPTLSAVPEAVFQLAPGGSGYLDFPVRVVESADWALPVSSTISGASWMSLSGASGVTPLNVSIRVSAVNLEPGTYSASIRFNSPAAVNDGLTVPIRLVVAPSPESDVTFAVRTIAGTGQTGNLGDNGLAVRAVIGVPDSLAFDASGNLFVSLPNSHVIRSIAPNGRISRYAGTAFPGFSGDGGQALLASFFTPRGLASGPGGLYVADSDNRRLRLIAPGGGNIITLFELERPRAVALDHAGNSYVALPTAHVIVKVTPQAQASVFAGTFRQSGFRGEGTPAIGALLAGPLDVAVGPDGTVYIADTENHRIRAVDAAGRIRTVAGNGLSGFLGDSDDARLTAMNRPSGVAVDSGGTVFASDTGNHLVRMITAEGKIETIAGNASAGFGGDDGPALSASFRQPGDLAVDSQGVIYVADTLNMRIRSLTASLRAMGPVIHEGGVTSSADQSQRLAPGSLFAISGSNLAPEAAGAPDGAWPQSLGGVTVTFGGSLAALSSVAPDRITGQIPWAAAPGLVGVVVNVNESASRPSPVSLSTWAPSIFSTSNNRALAWNEDGQTNSSTVPARAGSTVTVLLTGAGPLLEPLETGAVSPEEPFAIPAERPLITINRNAVEPVDYRMLPGRVGVAQIRFRVPNLFAGEHPVNVTLGGWSSGSPLISVR